VATGVFAMRNVEASPFRFDVDPQELLAVMTAIEDRGDEVGAIYHSHTRSEPRPSQTDITFAANWPGVEWLIVGLKGGVVDVRSWLIDAQGKVDQVA
jgi:[CysO sulfur-carrier protein]-S-L-cysteine hydrolase